MGDLLQQHLEALEQEAEEKGDLQQVLAEHLSMVYRVTMPLHGLGPLQHCPLSRWQSMAGVIALATIVLAVINDKRRMKDAGKRHKNHRAATHHSAVEWSRSWIAVLLHDDGEAHIGLVVPWHMARHL
jgi:hypothetical protein